MSSEDDFDLPQNKNEVIEGYIGRRDYRNHNNRDTQRREYARRGYFTDTRGGEAVRISHDPDYYFGERTGKGSERTPEEVKKSLSGGRFAGLRKHINAKSIKANLRSEARELGGYARTERKRVRMNMYDQGYNPLEGMGLLGMEGESLATSSRRSLSRSKRRNEGSLSTFITSHEDMLSGTPYSSYEGKSRKRKGPTSLWDIGV